MPQFSNFVTQLGRMNPWVLVLGALLAARLVDMGSMLLASLGPGFELGGPEAFLSSNRLNAVLLAVILGPALETVFLQALPILALQTFTPLSPVWIIVITGVLFGAGHAYSCLYVVIATSMGCLLSTLYLARSNGNGLAFLLTYTVHAANNAIDVGGMVFSNP